MTLGTTGTKRKRSNSNFKMAQWIKAQGLPNEAIAQIKSIYNEHFPIEVRHYLAEWIEEHFFSDQEPPEESEQYRHYIAHVINGLIHEIESRSQGLGNDGNFLNKLKLGEAAKLFREHSNNDVVQLYAYMKKCLIAEMKIIEQADGHISNIQINHSGAEILRQIDEIRKMTQASGEIVRKMEQDQEAFALLYHECTKLNAHITQISANPQNPQNMTVLQQLNTNKQKMDTTLNNKVAGLIGMRCEAITQLKNTYAALNALQARVLDEELMIWKREQQLAGNGAAFNSNLDTIQEWCEALAELIWQNRQQIKDIDRLRQKLSLEANLDYLPQLLAEITQLLSTLVTSTFIIEKQPPQVMKTNTRFTATVRLLVGGRLNVHMAPPQVRVAIISEAQANMLLKSEKITKSNDSSGEILNNTGTMEYQQASRQLSVSFRNMQLKKIKRAEKKGTESVMDEKFSLHFQSQFNVGGGELTFQVWTLSLPVVVIVHGNQEPHAWATVTWDNAFADTGRVPFVVPEKVPWCKVAETLSLKFKSATGRPLTDDNLRFLAEKAFRNNYTDMNQLLSWAQFCKEPLTERNFTFWEWFYAVMKLTREHLRGPWVDGAIMGFVRKKQTEELLSTRPPGTFLLRFSDSELGGITIAWQSENGIHREVLMLQPYTAKDFTIRSLADRIADLANLVYLYPDISKDIAFNKYYTPYQEQQTNTNPSNGYVKSYLKNHININDNGSVANTPQHMMSPEYSTRDTHSVTSFLSDVTAHPSSASNMDLEPYADMDYINNLVQQYTQ